MDEMLELLLNKYNWYEGIARAFVEAKGKCVYCGENLINTRLGYSSIVMDHLLPKAIYPEIEHDYRNHVLSCSSCNSMKSNYDSLKMGEIAKNMLINKNILIQRSISYLQPKIDARKNEWQEIHDLSNLDH